MADREVYAFTVTRAATPERVQLLKNTVEQAKKTAGMEFDWHVVLSGVSQEAGDYVLAAQKEGLVQTITHFGTDENIGQHVAWNTAFGMAKQKGYRYFLRLDDDCAFPSKRWLRKLVVAMKQVEDKFILSPVVKGLNFPPRTSQTVTVGGLPMRLLVDAIGGICRLHPVKLLEEKEFVADVRKPLGGGDATGMATWCKEHMITMAYLKACRVRHAKTTKGQEETDPGHFKHHQLFQHIPYIPPWKDNDATTTGAG